MKPWLVIVCFLAIGLMRVIQNVCDKKTSLNVNDSRTFFHYGAFYYLVAALFSVISLIFIGFNGFDLVTALCSLISALLFAVILFCTIESIKGCPIVVSTLFICGSLIISIIAGLIFFNESISFFQIGGLILYFVSMCLITYKPAESKQRISLKTYLLLSLNLVANGLITVVQKYFAIKVVNGNIAMFSFLTFMLNSIILAICFGVVSIKKRKTLIKESKPKFLPKILIICGTLLAFAIFVINMLVTELGKSVSSVILFPVSNALMIIITSLVGGIYYKEKMNTKNIIGLIFAIISIMIIGILSPETLVRIGLG